MQRAQRVDTTKARRIILWLMRWLMTDDTDKPRGERVTRSHRETPGVVAGAVTN